MRCGSPAPHGSGHSHGPRAQVKQNKQAKRVGKRKGRGLAWGLERDPSKAADREFTGEDGSVERQSRVVTCGHHRDTGDVTLVKSIPPVPSARRRKPPGRRARAGAGGRVHIKLRIGYREGNPTASFSRSSCGRAVCSDDDGRPAGCQSHGLSRSTGRQPRSGAEPGRPRPNQGLCWLTIDFRIGWSGGAESSGCRSIIEA